MVAKHNWQSLLTEYQLIANQMSAYEFCKLKKIDNSKFYRLAKSAGLEIRQNVYQNNSANLVTIQEIKKVEGHLLGDASILYVDGRKKTPVFALVSKHKDYISWVNQNSQITKERPVWIREQYDSRTDKTYTAFWVRSRASEFLKQQHERWYPKGKKIVPSDLTISKELLLRWYLDDGCLYKNQLFLSTDCFSKEDVEFLQSILLLEGFSSFTSRNGNGFRINFPKSQWDSFFRYIGDCPIECFSYKWNRKG